jgi:hypothetical protein
VDTGVAFFFLAHSFLKEVSVGLIGPRVSCVFV